MALPTTLTNFNLHIDGGSYLGTVTEVTLPKLTRKMEEHRAGGMDVPVELDMGMEKMELSYKFSGLVVDSIRRFGYNTLTTTGWRFSGAYRDENTGITTALEIFIRGKVKELDFGAAKAGDKTEQSEMVALSYIRIAYNGETVLEVDPVNLVLAVDGVDMYAARKAILGA